MTGAPAGVGIRVPRRVATPQVKVRSLSVNVRSGAIWSMASTIVIKVSSIAVTAIVARILSQHDFGVFAVANTVFMIVSAFGEFGISACLSRADIRASDLAPTLWTISLGSSTLIGVLLVGFAQPIAAGLGSPDGAEPVRTMAIIMLLTGVAAVPNGQCLRDFKQNKIFLANVLSFIPSTIVLLIMAKSGGGAMAFAWSRVAGQLTSCIVILLSVPKLYLPGMTRNALSFFFQFGVPLAVANFVGFLLQNIDYALIGRLMGPAMLGTYVVAFNAASWSSSLLGGVLWTVAVSAFSRVKHDPERLMYAMRDGVRAVILVAAPMGALEMVLARPLVITLYGAHWAAAARPLSILTLYGLISIICLLFSQMLAALGKSKFILAVQVVWLVALIPAMLIGVRTHGIVGAAAAHIFIIVPIVLPLYLFSLRQATGVRIGMLVTASLPALFAAAAAAAIAWAVMSTLRMPSAQLFAGGVAGGLFYLTVMAPQMLVMLGRGKIQHPAVRRVMRTYYYVGRSIGLRVGPPPRHARRRRLR